MSDPRAENDRHLSKTWVAAAIVSVFAVLQVAAAFTFANALYLLIPAVLLAGFGLLAVRDGRSDDAESHAAFIRAHAPHATLFTRIPHDADAST